MKKLMTVMLAVLFAGSTGLVYAQAKDGKGDKGAKAEAKKDEAKKDDMKKGAKK